MSMGSFSWRKFNFAVKMRKRNFYLLLQATDDDGKGQTTSVSLRIALADANDSPPKFQQSTYRTVIDEGAEKFVPELRIVARDKDKTSKITYSIVGGNEMTIFDINPNTGEITVADKGPVDITNATHDWVALTVRASDGTFTDDALVNITVRDVNNNAPIFLHDLYTASIPELSPIGQTLLFVLFLFSPRNADVTCSTPARGSNNCPRRTIPNGFCIRDKLNLEKVLKT